MEHYQIWTNTKVFTLSY